MRLNKRSIGPQPALRRVGLAMVGWGWLQRSIFEILGSPTWDPIWLKSVFPSELLGLWEFLIGDCRIYYPHNGDDGCDNPEVQPKRSHGFPTEKPILHISYMVGGGPLEVGAQSTEMVVAASATSSTGTPEVLSHAQGSFTTPHVWAFVPTLVP